MDAGGGICSNQGKKRWRLDARAWRELINRFDSIDATRYLIDALQRVGRHQASLDAEFTPRLWKQHFADQALRSDLHGIGA